MLILSVFLLSLAAVGSWLFCAGRANALLILSVIALYALQAGSGIFDVLLPTATLLLVIGVWWLITPGATESDWRALLLVGIMAAIIPMFRIIGGAGVGQTLLVLPAFGIVGIAAVATGALVPESDIAARQRLALAYIALIIILLVILKTPILQATVTRAITPTGPLDWGWLGFSYIAFRLMHTLLDYRHNRLNSVGLRDLLLYVIFFPSLSAGPIDRIEHFTRQLSDQRSLDSTRILNGGTRLMTGLFKKFVLADSLAYLALNPTLAVQIKDTNYVWAMVYAYAFRIYFDFSGYSDIAIGVGILAGIDLPENFAAPYSKGNIAAFWNSWHMTLTAWVQNYFFIPFSRLLMKSPIKKHRYLIILIVQVCTMALIGLWHGVAIHFVLWGVWHGIGLWLYRWFTDLPLTRAWDERVKAHPRLAGTIHILSILATFHFVAVGWIFFVLPDLSLIGRTFAGLLGFHG